MTEHLIWLFNVLVSFYASHSIILFPVWKTLGWKKRSTFIYFLCLTLYLCAAYFAVSLYSGMNAMTFRLFMIYVTVPPLIIAVWLFRKQIWQMVCLICLAFLYGTIATGIGSYAADAWFMSLAYPQFYAILIRLVTAIITLPPLLYILRRLFENPSIKQAVGFWRIVWLLPASFFAITVMSSSYLNDNGKDGGFILFRIFIYIALLITCYLIETSVRHAAGVEELTVKAELLGKLNRTKTEFLQNMSHEMKAPLTVIATDIDFADREIAKGSADLSEASAALESAQNQTQRLGRMVSGMIEMASLSEISDNRKRVDLSALLANTADAFRIALTRRGNRLTVDIAPGLPDVFVESERFSQVITNLFANALDHTQNGEINLAANTEDAFIIVRLTDTGSGIDAELLPNVFERGVSGRGGTGYGLYICKTIIEAHGGTIRAESEPGSGTAVTFTVPVYGGQEAGHRV